MRIVLTLVLSVLFTSGAFAQCEENGRYVSAVFDSVSTLLDVPYGSSIELNGDTLGLVFDYYEPFGDSITDRPLLILAHGGSFIAGDEDDISGVCEVFASYGYVTVSINYRLADIVPFGQGQTPFTDVTTFFADELIKATHDFRAAIRYFQDSATSQNMFGIDSEKIFIGGISAGAIAALNAAYMDDEEGIASIEGVDVMQLITDNGGFEGLSGNPGIVSNNIAGVINFSGALASVDLIQADEPPLVSLHDTGDLVVPMEIGPVSVSGLSIIDMEGSSVIHERALELGMDSEFLSFEQVAHVGYFTPDLSDQTYATVTNFLADYVCEEVVFDCQALMLNIGDPCDDGDALTENDAVGDDCSCVGSPIMESGVEDLLTGIKVFPSIVQSELNVEMAESRTIQASVVDISGNEIYAGESYTNFSIDCSTFAAGMYLLRLVDEGKMQATKFLVE